MPRGARIVVPGTPHHVTQRGNKREKIFFCDEDREFFLDCLDYYARRNGLMLGEYCLMGNHNHLIVIPETKESLSRAMKPLFMIYSQRLNKRFERTGINWQGRFYSCPMDDRHCYATMQYIAMNPVRAGLVKRAEDYRWSSAKEHLGLRSSGYLTASPSFLKTAKTAISNLKEVGCNAAALEAASIVMRNTLRNLPAGSPEFISDLESRFQRNLAFRPRGGQRKVLPPEKK